MGKLKLAVIMATYHMYYTDLNKYQTSKTRKTRMGKLKLRLNFKLSTFNYFKLSTLNYFKL